MQIKMTFEEYLEDKGYNLLVLAMDDKLTASLLKAYELARLANAQEQANKTSATHNK